MKSESPSAAVPVPPNRLADSEHPVDCIQNIRSIIALLSMINLEDDAVPDGAKSGHFYLLLLVSDALGYVERLLEQEAQS
ncbi:MAG TPA: hypothetical protein PLD30_12885 [Candidatus Competibacteraceae bacterium]|nr:hypothetical protein [Candidatus Competibacteraceae bacterium]